MSLNNTPTLLRKFVSRVFEYRYAICLIIVICIIILGFFLHFCRHWPAKDTAQVCTGFFIVLTLFFTALNYEFTTSKMKLDYKSAKEVMTFNTANEWHKAPVKDYQKTSIDFENKFIAANTNRNANDFEKFIDSEIEYKESLKGILNYFENVSIAVYKGLIDKEFIFEFYSYIFEVYYTDYFFYIENHRIKKNNNTIWINFTKLAEEWWPDLKDKIQKETIKSSIINKKI